MANRINQELSRQPEAIRHIVAALTSLAGMELTNITDHMPNDPSAFNAHDMDIAGLPTTLGLISGDGRVKVEIEHSQFALRNLANAPAGPGTFNESELKNKVPAQALLVAHQLARMGFSLVCEHTTETSLRPKLHFRKGVKIGTTPCIHGVEVDVYF